jgi:hypothetical protein
MGMVSGSNSQQLRIQLITGSERTEAEVIGLAWDCAAKAYEPDAASQLDGQERTGSRLDFSLPASATGSIKATTCTIFTPPQHLESSTASASVLVIAVRGSASKVDHIVNFHGEPRDAKDLFVSFALLPTTLPYVLSSHTERCQCMW